MRILIALLLAVPLGAYADEKPLKAEKPFLLKVQSADGSWSGDLLRTALAIDAFNWAGHTSRYGRYRAPLGKAMAWLRSRQQPSGRIGKQALGDPSLTAAHLIVTRVLLADAPGSAATRKALDYVVVVLRQDGWRALYEDAELLPLGWMALLVHDAREGRVEIPKIAIDRLREAANRPGRAPREVAAQLAARLVLGTTRKAHLVAYRKLVIGTSPEWTAKGADLPRWMFTKVAAQQLRREGQAWRKKMTSVRSSRQVMKEGRHRYSYPPIGRHAKLLGRDGTTAMMHLIGNWYHIAAAPIRFLADSSD